MHLYGLKEKKSNETTIKRFCWTSTIHLGNIQKMKYWISHQFMGRNVFGKMQPSSEIIPMSNSDQWLPHFISKKSLNLFIDVLKYI